MYINILKFLKIKITKNIFFRMSCLLIAFLFLSTSTATALNADQKSLYKQGINFYDYTECDPNDSSLNTANLNTGGSNAKVVYDFFVSKGYKPFQAAAIVGNMTVESGVMPQRLQSTPIEKITIAEEWTNTGGGGWGLVQWTPGSKMIDSVKAQGKDPNDIIVQLEFLFGQLEGTGALSEKAAGDQFKATTNIEDAVLAFQGNSSVGGKYIGFERPQDQRGSVPERTAAAKATLTKYGGSSPSGSTSTASSSGSISCGSVCTPNNTNATGKVVVLDPGHSGETITETDPSTGIVAKDYYNPGETEDMWQASQIITTKLEAKGFKVINTKKNAKDTVGLLARAKIANDSNANIAVSLHSTPGQFGNASAGWITPQEVGLYRKTTTKTKTFSDADVANLSKQYADKILAARKQSEGGAQIHRLPFDGRGLPATGNISIVQLFSTVPWVYNEVGQSGLDINKYAEGIANGIIDSLGTDPATSTAQEPGVDEQNTICTDSNGQANGNFSDIIKAFAWPDYHPPQYVERKPAYAEATTKAKKNGEYIGGSVAGVEAIDCGAFVTRVMLVSGFEPNYNYKGKGGNTIKQQEWLEANWQKINPKTAGDLQPGDVAINTEHTYVFVGKIDGFNSQVASASYSTRGNGRAPMAGKETPASSGFSWYRKKG